VSGEIEGGQSVDTAKAVGGDPLMEKLLIIDEAPVDCPDRGSAEGLAPVRDLPAADVPAIPLGRGDRLDAYVRRTLLQQERAIAKKYYEMGQKQMWRYVALTVVGFAVWASLLPLTILKIVPLWAAFIASSLLTTGGYIVAHEAIHDNMGRKGSKGRFWNQLVGYLGMFPLLLPYKIAQITHLEHHKWTNDPLRDPDYPDIAPTLPAAIFKYWLNRQPGKTSQLHHIRRIMVEEIGTPEAKKAFRNAILMYIAGMFFFIAMAQAGYAIEVACCWWLPRWTGLGHIRVGLSWEPHSPHDDTSRYGNTRLFQANFYPLSYWIEGHLGHHLYPNIPAHLCKPMLAEMRPILEQRGVDYTHF